MVGRFRLARGVLIALALAMVTTGCSLIADVGELAAGDAGREDADSNGDVGSDADADADADTDADTDVAGDADGDGDGDGEVDGPSDDGPDGFDPTVDYDGTFRVDPRAWACMCPGLPGCGAIDSLVFTRTATELQIQFTTAPFVVAVQAPPPEGNSFFAVHDQGCYVITLTGTFDGPDSFSGQSLTNYTPTCPSCADETYDFTASRS